MAHRLTAASSEALLILGKDSRDVALIPKVNLSWAIAHLIEPVLNHGCDGNFDESCITLFVYLYVGRGLHLIC